MNFIYRMGKCMEKVNIFYLINRIYKELVIFHMLMGIVELFMRMETTTKAKSAKIKLMEKEFMFKENVSIKAILKIICHMARGLNKMKKELFREDLKMERRLMAL